MNNEITHPPILGGVCNFEAEIATPEKTKKQKLHTAHCTLTTSNLAMYMILYTQRQNPNHFLQEQGRSKNRYGLVLP